MPTYQFYLDSFDIGDTRSHHEDTVIAGLAVAVNNVVTGQPQVAQMGDFNNGVFTFWKHGLKSLDGIVIQPPDTFVFVFEMYNNGHDNHPNTGDLNAF